MVGETVSEESIDIENLPKMSGKMAAFVDYYLGGGDGESKFQGKKSAIAAGYSPKTAESQASQMLKHYKVRAHMDHIIKSRALSRDQVLSLLAEDASRSDSDIRAFARGFAPGAAEAAGVSAMSQARQKARELLAKANGAFTENINVTGSLKREYVIVLPDTQDGE